MNKKLFTAVASATAAIAAVGLINAGPAAATAPLGPANNSCGNSFKPEAKPNGVLIPDTNAVFAGNVHISSLGTGSLTGDIPGTLTPDGIFVPTGGLGIGTLSGSYHNGVTGGPCTVNGTFMLP
ncbi:hypothetical protein [Rhodococcus koreensis]